ncbi:MAG TPA: ECF transporter S component [Candidatus Limnocylindrales bacterium]|nr:ECF transporter S component [Candidatus Limnocylindrales bacterium]
MTTLDRAQPGAPTNPVPAWRTRDILLAAIIGVVFGVVFFIWNGFYAGLEWIQPPVLKDVVYGMWLVPAILAPLLIRKPGAALFAEMAAAGVSALLGNQWGPDTLLSGFMQGAAAEVVFAVLRYRAWSLPVLAVAAVAAATGAWVHDWFIYYAGFAVDIQLVRFAIMAVSAVAFAAFGSLAIQRSLRRAGVLREPSA